MEVSLSVMQMGRYKMGSHLHLDHHSYSLQKRVIQPILIHGKYAITQQERLDTEVAQITIYQISLKAVGLLLSSLEMEAEK